MASWEAMISVFRDLIARVPTFAAFEAFIESEEGGRLRIIDRKEGVCLIRYEKGRSNLTLPHVPWFRSVAWDMVQHRPLSVAPPRKVDAAEAAEGCKQPLLDGVMVNVYVKPDGSWDLTTRSRLGASGYFYSSKPFSQLFLEALHGVESIDAFVAPLVDAKPVFYSFLLQHVENRNVTPHIENAVYVIHKGVVEEDGSLEWDDFPAPPAGTRSVADAPIHPTALSWVDQGSVWRDGKGGRVIERREEWKRVKALRGNDASDMARFLRLYHGGVLAEYVGYYPEEEPYMCHHAQWMHTITSELFTTYRDIYVRRVKKREAVDRMWWPHVYELQKGYLKTRVPLTLVDVAEYLRVAPWHRVAHLIRGVQSSGDMPSGDMLSPVAPSPPTV